MIDRERAAETLQPEPPPLHLHGQEKMFERPRAIGGFSQARLDRMHTDRVEASPAGMVPLDRLAKIAPACRISRARVVDAGRIVTAGGIASELNTT